MLDAGGQRLGRRRAGPRLSRQAASLGRALAPRCCDVRVCELPRMCVCGKRSPEITDKPLMQK